LLHRLDNWSAISIGSISMGQEIGVTPLQLVTAVSAIANGGLLIKPHVVQQIERGEQVLSMPASVSGAEPKRVIRPETAATLRRLMEGVVLDGTGTKARLDGWTAAGKTGSAQKIDPATGRYSPTQLIASFTGFAPISNPAVTILISLDSPVGLHEGGQVAAPVFKRVAEQVLAYLDVPRDVPLNPRLIEAAYKRQNRDNATLEDFSPTDFSGQPDALPTASNPAEPEPKFHAPEVAMAGDEGGDITVPDFTGKTMREVTELCLHLGLEPLLVGSNLAVDQHPESGTQVRRGAKVTVQFGTPEPVKPTTHTRGRR
jgi:cell division protein FtsI (penicillin-binding protein 3)